MIHFGPPLHKNSLKQASISMGTLIIILQLEIKNLKRKRKKDMFMFVPLF